MPPNSSGQIHWTGTPNLGADNGTGQWAQDLYDWANKHVHAVPHTPPGPTITIGGGSDGSGHVSIQNPPLVIPGIVPPKESAVPQKEEKPKPRPKRIGGFGKTGVRKFKKP
jgi:hypothetical protein